MTRRHFEEICGCFDGFDDIYSDRSTEFLIQMTSDTMKCSYADVVDALRKEEEQKGMSA